MTARNPVNVSPGQVWEDCDPREKGRRIRVITLTRTHAVVARVAPSLGTARTKIRLDRFRPGATGYRLVEEGGEMR